MSLSLKVITTHCVKVTCMRCGQTDSHNGEAATVAAEGQKAFAKSGWQDVAFGGNVVGAICQSCRGDVVKDRHWDNY